MTDWNGKPTDFDYVYLADEDLPGWPIASAWPPLNDLTLLKKIDNAGLRGPTLYIYSTRNLPEPEWSVFKNTADELHLTGLSVNANKDKLYMDSYWQSPKHSPTLDYSYFIHLTPVGEPSVILGQQDGSLGVHRTSTWSDPQEILSGGIQPFSIPDLPSGEYVVTFGVYFSQTGERLTLDNGQNELELLRFSVF